MNNNFTKKGGLAIELDNAQQLNYVTYWYNFDRLLQKALAMFEWVNLPPEIDERYLELSLLTRGWVCFFRDEELGIYMALECTLGGKFNVYNTPTQYHIFTASGYNTERTAENSVVIFNNYIRKPILNLLNLYAQRLTNIERTIDVNLNQLKKPYIYLVPENQVTTVKAMFNNIKKNEELIVGNDKITIDEFNVVSRISPNNTLDLYTLKKKTYNEALTDLGINNLFSDKKERLVSEEATSNEQDVMIDRQAMLDARKQACKQINAMFDLDIDVRFKQDVVEGDTVIEIEEDQNGEVQSEN